MKLVLFVLTLTLILPSLATAKGDVSSVSVNMIQFTGEKDKSLYGTYGFAADFTASNSDGVFRLQYGADFQYAKALSYINTTSRNATYYGTDFKIGFAIVPVPEGIISPFIEAAGLVGIKSLSFDQPQTTIPRESVGLSRGYRMGVGVNLGVFDSSSLKVAAYLVDSRAVKLAGQSDYNLSSLTFSLGLNF
jgi:hypothetical protein